MNEFTSTKRAPYCKVCLVPHDEEIHAATLNVRQWFFDEVTKHFESEDEYIVFEQPEETINAA